MAHLIGIYMLIIPKIKLVPVTILNPTAKIAAVYPQVVAASSNEIGNNAFKVDAICQTTL